jgi:hypothetical protein
MGDASLARSTGSFWLSGTLEDNGDVKSVSPVVELERLLDEDGKWGAENVLDAADIYDSCESGNSRLYSGGRGAGWATLRFSRGIVVSILYGLRGADARSIPISGVITTKEKTPPIFQQRLNQLKSLVAPADKF